MNWESGMELSDEAAREDEMGNDKLLGGMDEGEEDDSGDGFSCLQEIEVTHLRVEG